MISCKEKYNINRKVYLLNVYNSKGIMNSKLLLSKSLDQDIQDLLVKMSKGKATKKNIELIKDEYSEEDFMLINKYIKTSELIFDTIYPDETFNIFKMRLHIILNVREDDNVYIWLKKNNVSNNDLLEIINLMFGNLNILSKDIVISNCKNIFDRDITTILTENNVNKINLYNILVKLDDLKINQQIGYSYIGSNLETKYIESNPFNDNAQIIDDNFVSSSGEKNYIYNIQKYDKLLLETITYNIKEFNICLKSDLLEYAKKKNNNDLLLHSLEYKYFPLSNIENIRDIKETLNILDERINKTQMNAINNSQEYLKYLKIILKPTYSINTVNLETIFKNIKTLNIVPFIVYRSKTNNKYKVIKQSLNKIYDDGTNIIIDINHFKKWTTSKNKIIERPKESLLFKYYIKKYSSYNKFITIILHENLDINIIYNFDINEKFTLDELIESFDNINKFIINIIKDYTLIYPLLTNEILDRSNILINLFNLTLNLELNLVKTFEQDEITSLINYMYPYFDKIESDKFNYKNLIKFKYKRVNSYFSEKDIYKLLKKNHEKTELNKIEILIERFLITRDKATELCRLYEDYSDDLIKFEKNFIMGTFIILNFYRNKVVFNNINSYNEFCRIRNLVNSLYKINILDNIEKIELNVLNKINSNSDDNSLPSISLSKSLSLNSLSNSSRSTSRSSANIYIPDYDDDDINNETEEVNFLKDEDNVAMEEKTIKHTEKKKKNIYMSILDKLSEADPVLFNFKASKEFSGYSKQCQNNRQPIVLNREEKNYIDKYFPRSYTGYLQYGSSINLMNKNFYICPSIWCHISRVSLTQEDLNERGGKCPEGEDPTKFDYKIENNIEIYNKRFPGFLGKGKGQKHPDNYNLPCCFKNKQKDTLETIYDEEEKKNSQSNILEDKNEGENEKYIFGRVNMVTPFNRYTILPPVISSLLQDESNNQGGSINRETKSYVRKGVEEVSDMFLSSIVMLLNNDDIKSVRDLLNIVIDNLKPLDYLRLNNGNTLKLYYTNTRTIYMKDEFREFKEWLNNNTIYVNKLELGDLVNYLNELSEFKIYRDDTNEILRLKKNILREYLIFNSYTNFLYYLQSDIPKNHEEMLDLLSSKFNFVNKHKYNIIILNEDIESNNTFICCSKYYDSKYEVDLLKPFVFILRTNIIYEPLIYIESFKGSVKETKNFNIMNNSVINNIVNIYRRNCNIEGLKNYINPRKLEQIILSLSNTIKYLVITTDLKSIGFILHNNLFVPFNRYNSIYTLKYKLIYLQDIYKLKVKLDSEDITKNIDYLTKFYNNINKLLLSTKNTENFYNINEVIENNNKLEAILLQIKNFDNVLIPVNLNQEYDNELINEIVLLSKINEEIFINYQEKNEEKIYNEFNIEKDTLINKALLLVSNFIISNPSIYQEINHIKHPLNPFNLKEKQNMIINIIDSIANEIKQEFTLTDKLIKIISEEILYKDISVIIKSNLFEMKLQDNEILFDQQDIEANKIDEIIKSIDNPFKNILSSSEDSINYIDIKLNKTLKDWNNIITNNYEDILPKTPWGIMMKDYKINVATEYNNLYLLKLFKKISSFKLHNKTTVNILQEFINNKRLTDYIQNQNYFLTTQKNNIRFKNLFKNFADDSWIAISSIFDNPDYYFSTYEILALAEFININVTIIGRSRKDGEFPNGIIHVYNDSEFYIFFHITLDYEKKKYNKIQLIMKNDKVILTRSDIKDNLWRMMQANILTEIIVDT